MLQKCINFSRPFLRLFPKDFKTSIKKLIRYNINSPDYWDAIWEAEGEDTWRDYVNKYPYIISLVPDGVSVLDIGCGVGLLLRKMRDAKPNMQATGADISAKAIDIVKNHGFEGVVGGFPVLPLESGRFDIVLATEVLEHLSNPQEAVREVGRLLKPDGKAIITVPDDCLGPEDEVQHLRKYTSDTLYTELSSGFERIEITSIPDFSYNFLVAVCEGPRK